MNTVRAPESSSNPREESAGHRSRWPAGLMVTSAAVLAVAGYVAISSGVEDRGAVITEITASSAGSGSAADDSVDRDLKADTPTVRPLGEGEQLVTADRWEALALAASPVPPVQVVIPALDLETSVITVGLDSNRAVEVPEDIGIVGWYEHASYPGSTAGSAVLVGHRDGSGGRKGIFYSIGSLEPGDEVEVVLDSGDQVAYEVVARELINNVDFDANAPRLFARDGNPVLTLISCGGLYDRNNGGYQSNIVVTAEPIPST